MILEILVLFVSIGVLAKSSSLVVESAAKLSRFFGIGSMAIGFLFISVLTSLPELSVSIISSTAGEGEIAAGNVFGSNIANILLVLGLGSFLYGLKIGKESLKDISLILVLTTILSTYIIFNSSIRSQALGFLDGIILLMIFILYSGYIISRNKKVVEENNQITKKEASSAFLYFCISIGIVLISSSFVVESAVKLAKLLNIAESFIGATVIAVGTSLPELSIDIQAIRKKQYGLALGDAIGSNMTNITLVLGTAALISPISVILPVFIAALLFAIVANILLFYVASVNKSLGRIGGTIFLILYFIYVTVIFYLQISELTNS